MGTIVEVEHKKTQVSVATKLIYCAATVVLLVLSTGCSPDKQSKAVPLSPSAEVTPTPEAITPSAVQTQSPIEQTKKTTQPLLTKVPSPDTNTQQIKKGEKVFKNIRTRAPAVMQVRGGALPGNATASLIIPKSSWESLSKLNQVSLTFFLESLIPEVRDDPATFTDISSTAPAYSQIVSNIGNICDSCWVIIVGEVTSTNDLTVDETVVQGDMAWEKDEYKFGVKASDFRTSTPPASEQSPSTQTPTE